MLFVSSIVLFFILQQCRYLTSKFLKNSVKIFTFTLYALVTHNFFNSFFVIYAQISEDEVQKRALSYYFEIWQERQYELKNKVKRQGKPSPVLQSIH